MNLNDDLDYDSIDPAIRPFVRLLREHRIETIESCQGGIDHYSQWPYIAFKGGKNAGSRAVRLIAEAGQPVWRLDQVWKVADGQLKSPPVWIVNLEAVPGGEYEC